MIGREEIYEQLTAQIPELKRRECTPRVMAGVDLLLDQLNIIVEGEMEQQLGRDFTEVFGD